MRATKATIAALIFLFCLSFGRNHSIEESDIVFLHTWVADIDKADFKEPSGICWHSERETLYVVGDEGDICEIETDGTLIKKKRIRKADFEGVAHDPATGLLYVAVEGDEAVLEINPDSLEVLREFDLPRKLNGRTVMSRKGQGIEGITFAPDSGHPQGGIFHIANQAFSLTNENDLSAVFQFELPLRDKAGEPKLMGYFEPGIVDLSGLHYDPATGNLFVVSDMTNTVHEYSSDQALLRSYALPGENQEGITADNAGFWYIAQDSGGIIKLQGSIDD
jgi:uncharacterized protein YjiK